MGSASVDGRNREAWSKPRLPFQNSLRSPRPGRISPRMPAMDEDYSDTVPRWIELEEIGPRSGVGEASSPEPDVDGRNGVFIATEINQEVRRVRVPRQRPRLITIPQRARVDHSQV